MDWIYPGAIFGEYSLLHRPTEKNSFFSTNNMFGFWELDTLWNKLQRDSSDMWSWGPGVLPQGFPPRESTEGQAGHGGECGSGPSWDFTILPHCSSWFGLPLPSPLGSHLPSVLEGDCRCSQGTCCCVSADGGRRYVSNDSQLLLLFYVLVTVWHGYFATWRGRRVCEISSPLIIRLSLSMVRYLHPPSYKYW